MNPKNSKKSPIHENADANITCDFGDGDISRSRSFLSTTGLNHATNMPQTCHMQQTSINNPLNPSGVGLVNFFCESQSRLSLHMRAKFGRGPTVVSKKGSLKFISRLYREGLTFTNITCLVKFIGVMEFPYMLLVAILLSVMAYVMVQRCVA